MKQMTSDPQEYEEQSLEEENHKFKQEIEESKKREIRFSKELEAKNIKVIESANYYEENSELIEIMHYKEIPTSIERDKITDQKLHIKENFNLKIQEMNNSMSRHQFKVLFAELNDLRFHEETSENLPQIKKENFFTNISNFILELENSESLEKSELEEIKENILRNVSKIIELQHNSSRKMFKIEFPKVTKEIVFSSIQKEVSEFNHLETFSLNTYDFSFPIIFDTTIKYKSKFENGKLIRNKLTKFIHEMGSPETIDLEVKKERNLISCLDIIKIIETQFEALKKLHRCFDIDLLKLKRKIYDSYNKGKCILT
jgi:hypothetical protein